MPDKEALLQAWEKGSIESFDAQFHQNTDYARWRHATRLYLAHFSTSEIREEFPAQVRVRACASVHRSRPQYEPYVLAVRNMLPKYDERFRGARVMDAEDMTPTNRRVPWQ